MILKYFMQRIKKLFLFLVFSFIISGILSESAFALIPSELVITDIGSFGGSTYIQAINNNGQVAGISRNTTTGYDQAFIWDKINGMMPLNGVPPSFDIKIHSINDNGKIIGYYFESGIRHNFIWDKINGMQLLDSISPQGSLDDLNNFDKIVGAVKPDGSNARGFIWDETTGLVVFGTLGGFRSFATDINDANQVTGISSLTDFADDRVFLFDNQGMVNLGLPIGGYRIFSGVDPVINNAGQVAGVYEKPFSKYSGFFGLHYLVSMTLVH
jgi:uncharacterized membrane protein